MCVCVCGVCVYVWIVWFLAKLKLDKFKWEKSQEICNYKPWEAAWWMRSKAVEVGSTVSLTNSSVMRQLLLIYKESIYEIKNSPTKDYSDSKIYHLSKLHRTFAREKRGIFCWGLSIDPKSRKCQGWNEHHNLL